MGQPRRHGHRWSSVPTPLADGAPAIAVRGSLTPAAGPGAPPQAIPVRDLDAFLSALPRESVSFLSKSQEVRYDQALQVGQSIQIGSLKVPSKYVWIFTDVSFYAFGPAIGMGQAPQPLNRGALVGLLRLDLLFGGASPLNSQSYRMSPYSSPGQSPATTSGWPWLESTFGVSRMPSFALYAGETQAVEMNATVEDVPRFPITKIGVNLHGFSLPTATFSKIWLK